MATSSTRHTQRYPGFDNPQSWTIPAIMEWQSSNHPDNLAIEFVSGRQYTYQQLQHQTCTVADALVECGIKRNDVVALVSDDPASFVAVWLALARIGVVMVAINTGLRGAPLKHQLAVADVTHAITDDSLYDKVFEVCSTPITRIARLLDQSAALTGRHHTRANTTHKDLSAIMFTSGTSGPSKGVLMPQAHCVLFAVGTIENLDLGDGDSYYICLPLFHANGLYMQLLACLMAGVPAIVRGRFSASNWLRDIRQHGATHTNTLGAIAAFIAAQPETADDKHHILRVVSAAPLPASVESVFRLRFGITSVVPLYGMTEVNIPLYGELNHSAPGTIGKLWHRYFQVEIRHPETDDPIPDGEIGELMVRPKQSHAFMSGYVNMPEKTLEAWRNLWFHTGDAAYFREDGYFVFVDRIKDCIRRRGENISSYEVEQAFLALDGVAEAAAYAVPATDKSGTEQAGLEDEVMVAVQLAPGLESNAAELRDRAARNLPVFAVPRYLRLVNELPRTPTGKIRKTVLREQGLTTDTWDAHQ